MKIKKILIVLCSIFLFSPLINITPLTEAKREKSYQEPDISILLRQLEEKAFNFKSLKTDFVQEKKLAIFQKKIVLSGRIYLQKPNKIVWHVDDPIKYSVFITDKFIRQWDEDTDQTQEMLLSSNPVFQVAVNQLTAWFSGNYISLLDDYNVHVEQQHPFVLKFVPKETNVAKKIIKSITIIFRKDEKYLKEIKIQEISGDSTTIIFKNTILNAPIDNGVFVVNRRVR